MIKFCIETTLKNINNNQDIINNNIFNFAIDNYNSIINIFNSYLKKKK